MTDSTSLHPSSTQPLDHAALERIVQATGGTLSEDIGPDSALGILNMIVIETSAALPNIRSVKEDLSRFEKALKDLQASAEDIRKKGFGPPLPPDSFLDGAKRWLDAHERELEKDDSSLYRGQLLTQFYPKALGAYAALFNMTPTVSVDEQRDPIVCSATVTFSDQIIKETRNAKPELLLGGKKPSDAEKEALRGWTTGSIPALAKSLQKSKKDRYEYEPEAWGLPLKNASDQPLKWEAYRDFYLTLFDSEG
ncbi:hypothetical protein [Thioclava sp.]|uniref:hypothetical protein n=1 Tax=Thioclava sp. TaxID=1933450 RepID=UPI003AA989F1